MTVPTALIPVIIASLVAGAVGLFFAMRERHAHRISHHSGARALRIAR
jgi:hypothetical protein